MQQETGFDGPPLRPTVASVVAHFRSDRARGRLPLRNPHREPRVPASAWRTAARAAVLVPIVIGAEAGDEPLGLLLTRRDDAISHPGHICFPGGRCDAGDAGPVHSALRETEEEIGLAPDAVRVIGRLGDYVTHSGFRIQPVIGLVERPLRLEAQPGEVSEILEFPLEHVLDARSYRLRGGALGARWPETRQHFYIEYAGAVVAGPTVSLLMGLYEELLESEPSAQRPAWAPPSSS